VKTLLIIGAGFEQAIAIRIAKKMGLYVVASDKDPNAIGFKYSDARIIASTMDPKETLKAAIIFNRKRKINGIITVGSDAPVTIATVAQALSLPSISMKTAILASNKLLMKERFKKDKVPIPWFKEVKSVSELRNIAKERSYNIIIKPVDSRGSRGVLRLSPSIDLNWAFNRARIESPSNKVMVEEFLEGPQISTESIVYKGRVYTLGYADRNYEYMDKFAPYIVENGGETPTRYLTKEKSNIDAVFNKAIRSLGIINGTAKGDLVLTKNGPKVIELAARMSGGYFCTDSIPIVTGINFVEKAIKIALGEKLYPSELKAKHSKAAANRYIFPEPGTVRRISGISRLKKLKWVKRIGVYVKVGDKLGQITDHSKQGGFILVSAKDRITAKKRVEKAIKYLKIETN
jgi:biotin carboxylase